MFGKWNYPSNYCPIYVNLMELQNGKRNQTLKEMINALLINFGLPQNLCGGTILTAKGNNKKFCLFIKKAMEKFVFPRHNLFHMRNGKEGNPT